jgi:hypothetical protein
MWKGLLFGGLAGLVVSGIVLSAGRKKLDEAFENAGSELLRTALPRVRTQVLETLQTQVPPLVRSSIDAKFREYGITPAAISNVNRALDAARRLGLI